MPVTALDAKTALVVIDLQKGLLGFPTLHPLADVIAKTALLAAAFRRAKLPVVLVSTAFTGGDEITTRSERAHRMGPTPPEFSEIAPELGPEPGDILIVKRQWSAFYGTELDLQLRRRGVTGLVFTGVATSIGVDSSARSAHARAYNIAFASDALTDLDQAAHDVALGKIFPRIAEIDTTDAILARLTR